MSVEQDNENFEVYFDGDNDGPISVGDSNLYEVFEFDIVNVSNDLGDIVAISLDCK